MMPQFHRARCVFECENVAVGLTLLMFGLFKKAYLADGIMPIVKTLYEQAGGSGSMSLVLSWMAAIGFTFQIYFDFSGYTDMAIGIARIFGIKLPQNFNSPLRAASIIDFWLRWHMTLTRFLTAYLYNPLALHLTRARLAKGLPGFGGRNSSLGGYFTLLVFPTMLTMVVSGFWHGAGYLYILWGAMHGAFLSINHGWRVLARGLWKNKALYERIMRPIGHVVTFVAVVGAMVFFRAATLHAAINIVQGMVGLHGVYLPQTMLQRLGGLGIQLQHLGVRASPPDWFPFNDMVLWIVALAAIVFLAPNTQQILARYEPALGAKEAGVPVDANRWLRLTAAVRWRPTLAWACVVATVAAVGVLQLSGPSEFLYWQF
jgi:D-alanyl-lipoteichoic acid acyltransferase DltB (MBOAT superfamily)